MDSKSIQSNIVKEKWISVKQSIPAEGKKVLTKIDDVDGVRNEQVLIRKGRLWFHEDMSMYVYYIPTHWRWDED